MAHDEQTFDFDFFLVGAGQANVPLGPKLIQDGHRVGLAEREHMGGSCVNFGCMPSKAVHASARVAHQARLAKDWGIDIDSAAVRPVLKDVLARARVWSSKAEQHITSEYAKQGIKVFAAHARLAGRHGDGFRIALDDNAAGQTVTARQVV
ncbi:MAG: FAD-dependent oxidoreductase, partial [Planctomycetota bacterium]